MSYALEMGLPDAVHGPRSHSSLEFDEDMESPEMNATLQPRIGRDAWPPAASAPASRRLARIDKDALHSAVRGLSALGILGVAATIAFLGAFAIRYEGRPSAELCTVAFATLLLVVPLKIAAAVARGLHRQRWADASFGDAVDVAAAATLGTLLVLASRGLIPRVAMIPKSVLAIDWATSLLLLGGVRGVFRLGREGWASMASRGDLTPVLIHGSAEEGEGLSREIRRRPELGLKIVGYLDPDRSARGRKQGGIPVLGTPDELPRLALKHRVGMLLIPEAVRPAGEVDALVASCGELGIRARVVPRLEALLKGQPLPRPQEVDLDALLGREPVDLDERALGTFLGGKVVLVSGAAGSIGSEICRQVLALRPSRLVLMDHSENGLFFLERELKAIAGGAEIVPCLATIRDAQRLRGVFAEHRPEVVLHAAAHKHVPMIEAHPGEAIKNNVFGTRNLVDEAIRSGAQAFVMISTDKAVNPSSVMGATKRLAEMYLQSRARGAGTRLVTVRFGNVLGSAGSVVPIFLEQIRRGGPVTVTHPEMTRYFMSIPEASRLVLQAGAIGRGGEIYVLDMGEPVRIVDLAKRLIRMAGACEGREVPIAYTGLRPGEKMYEELYDHGEERLPTAHSKIFRARHRPFSEGQVRAAMEGLAELADGPSHAILSALARVVPGFRPGRRAPDPEASAVDGEPENAGDLVMASA